MRGQRARASNRSAPARADCSTSAVARPASGVPRSRSAARKPWIGAGRGRGREGSSGSLTRPRFFQITGSSAWLKRSPAKKHWSSRCSACAATDRRVTGSALQPASESRQRLPAPEGGLATARAYCS